jgi:hypothetical protein
VNLGNLEAVLLELLNQFGGVQLAVTSSSLDDLGLLLQCEVLPCEVWSDIFLEKAQDLIVGDGTGVGEIVDAGILVLGHEDGSWKEVMEDGVGVGDIDNTLVLGNLGYKVTGVQVVADGHAKSEDESVTVIFHNLHYR